MSLSRARLRAGLVVGATVALVLGTSAVASAHVHVTSDSTEVGSDATLTFRVPTESETASTTKIVVTLPTDHPLLDVTPQMVTGFTVEVVEGALPSPVVVDGTTLTKAPHEIVWTATGTGIPPEQFADFGVLVEDLPDAPELAFPTAQHYSDGTVVEWNQPTPAGGAEPEHPTPTLQLTPAASGDQTSTPGSSSPSPTVVAGGTAPTGSTRSTSTAGVWLGVAAIVVAVAALVVALTRARRPRGATASPEPISG